MVKNADSKFRLEFRQQLLILMNRYLSLLFTSLFFTVTLNINAQSKSFEYGLKAGADLYRHIPDHTSTDKYEGKFGVYVGIFANIEISDEIRLQPELLYLRHHRDEGYSRMIIRYPSGATPMNIGNTNITISETIVQFPMLIQYHFVSKFYLELGPQFGYIIDKRFEVSENQDTPFLSEATLQTQIEYDQFDFGVAIGAGYRFNNSIGMSMRYFFGIPKRDNQIKSSIFNMGIEVSL